MSERAKTLTINEIYQSIQGESTWAGLPCVFVRLTFCDLRCTYCDTEYAFYEGKKQTLPEIATEVPKLACPLVEITGGEPLLQKNVLPLMTAWRRRPHGAVRDERRARHFAGRSAGASHHGFENAGQRRSGAQSLVEHRAPDRSAMK